MLRNILIGLGGTPYTDAAVRHGIRLAVDHNAAVTAASVVDVAAHAHVGATPAGAIHAARAIAERRIQVTEDNLERATASFRATASEHGVPHRVLRETGDPFDLMSGLRPAHDLSIFGLRSVFEYGLIAEPKDALRKLLCYAGGPILAAAREYRPVGRILVGYDGRPESNRAFRTVLDNGLWRGAIIRLVHCKSGHRTLGPVLEDVATLGRLHGYPTEFAEVEGRADVALMQSAEAFDADVVVLGYRSRGVLARSLFGCTVDKMIRRSETSLLLAD